MKNVCLMGALISLVITNAQIVTIPDANFKNALVNTLCVDTDGDHIYDDDADTNNDGEIQITEAEAVLSLWLYHNNIASMEGIQSFRNLEILICSSNNINSIDLSQNTNLVLFNCINNFIDDLDLSQNLNLETLACGDNPLNQLDLSLNTNLKGLSCTNTQLSSLDLTNNLELTSLYCSSNQLLSLDVSQNLLLEELFCYHNFLTNLDLSNNTALTSVWTSNNNLVSINVSQNPNIEQLDVDYNQLTDIDVSQVTNLWFLDIDNNQLTSLDISQNPNIEQLLVRDNQLTHLNLNNGNNTALSLMFSGGNLDLNCIKVDNENYANSTECNQPGINWCKDTWTTYREDCTLSINDIEPLTFTVYPNPTQEVLNVASNIPIDSFKLYSIQGRLIKESIKNHIDVSRLGAGVYFIQVTFDSKTGIQQFIKL